MVPSCNSNTPSSMIEEYRTRSGRPCGYGHMFKDLHTAPLSTTAQTAPTAVSSVTATSSDFLADLLVARSRWVKLALIESVTNEHLLHVGIGLRHRTKSSQAKKPQEAARDDGVASHGREQQGSHDTGKQQEQPAITPPSGGWSG